MDPCHNFWDKGGDKFDFINESQFFDQLSSFNSVLSCYPHLGSIIRLPLRTSPSKIGEHLKAVGVSEVRQLLQDFIDEEIGIALLFLGNVTSIEVLEIDKFGNRSLLALSTVKKSSQFPLTSSADQDAACMFTCEVERRRCSSPTTVERWGIHRSSFSQSSAASLLSRRAECDTDAVQRVHKLEPEVSLAVPLSILTRPETFGRLYTYLPLPIPTGFPLHLHSPFALTPSRQNLRNRDEKGLVHGSVDRFVSLFVVPDH